MAGDFRSAEWLTACSPMRPSTIRRGAEGNPIIATWIMLTGALPALLGAKLLACVRRRLICRRCASCYGPDGPVRLRPYAVRSSRSCRSSYFFFLGHLRNRHVLAERGGETIWCSCSCRDSRISSEIANSPSASAWRTRSRYARCCSLRDRHEAFPRPCR